MTMEALGRPCTHSKRGRRATRSATRRSLVQPASSMAAARSAGVATVSNSPIGGKRDGIRRKLGCGAAVSGSVMRTRCPRPTARRLPRPGRWAACKARPRRVEEPPHAQQPILRAAGQQRQRRFTTEHGRGVRRAQPGDALGFGDEQHAQSLVDAKHGGNPQQRVEVQAQRAMLARRLDPAVKGGARRHAKDEAPLLLGQSPEIGDRQKGPHAGSAETLALFGRKTFRPDQRWSWPDGGRGGGFQQGSGP